MPQSSTRAMQAYKQLNSDHLPLQVLKKTVFICI